MADAIILTHPIGGASSGTAITGVSVSTINGQPMLTLEDTTRANKILSVAEQSLVFAQHQITHLGWIRISSTTDADSGYVADFDGTITSITAHCENTNTTVMNLVLYVDGTPITTLGTLSGGDNVVLSNQTLNIDFNQNQRIRLRAEKDGIDDIIQDTVIKLTVKWRRIP